MKHSQELAEIRLLRSRYPSEDHQLSGIDHPGDRAPIGYFGNGSAQGYPEILSKMKANLRDAGHDVA